MDNENFVDFSLINLYNKEYENKTSINNIKNILNNNNIFNNNYNEKFNNLVFALIYFFYNNYDELITKQDFMNYLTHDCFIYNICKLQYKTGTNKELIIYSTAVYIGFILTLCSK